VQSAHTVSDLLNTRTKRSHLDPRPTFLYHFAATAGTLASAVLLFALACDLSAAPLSASVDEPTLHTSEIGYETYGPKRAFVVERASANELPPGSSFVVRDDVGRIVNSGVIGEKKTKWGRDFWKIDFSSVTEPGFYQVSVTLGSAILTSSKFAIGDTPLLNAQMFQIAVHQLDERYPSPMQEIAPYFGAYLPSNRTTISDLVYSNSPDVATFPYREPKPGDNVPRIWRDCSSNYTEVESGGVTLLALIDLYEKIAVTSGRFSPAQIADLVTNVQRGIDYFVALQESHPGDTLRDGRFRHSTLVNTMDGGWWAGNVHLWHDTVFGALVLARGSAALVVMAAATEDAQTRTSLKQSAAAALGSAKAAWRNANARQYYLPEDLDTSFIPGYSLGVFWPWTDWRRMARAMYGVTDETWDMGTTLRNTHNFAGLRSRELITFLNATTALYQVTDEPPATKAKYLATAKRVASELVRRQYLAIDSPLDGVSGMFHEFSGSSGAPRNAFLLESAQAGMTHIGNYEFTSLRGFIDLLTLLPKDAEAALWHRAVELWANAYQAAAADRNPLGIAPVTVYSSTRGEEGPAAVYWFGNHLHGGNEIPGQAAHSLLEVGNYLNDSRFYSLAVNDVQYYAGLNAGIGDAHEPSTFIKGVGAKTVIAKSMEASAPIGSVANGFSSTGNFSPSFYVNYDENKTIPPDSVGDGATTGQESWILHSHSYVMGVAAVEAPFILKVVSKAAGVALAGIEVRFEYPLNESLSPQTFVTDGTGAVTVDAARLGQSAVVRLSRAGYPDYILPLAIVGGGRYTWAVDYRDHVQVRTTGLPRVMSPHTVYPVTLVVDDLGDSSPQVRLTMAYAGLSSATRSATLKPLSGPHHRAGTSRVRSYSFKVSSGSANQPYVLRLHVASGSDTQIINNSGTIKDDASK
jgi:hypothetical protein